MLLFKVKLHITTNFPVRRVASGTPEEVVEAVPSAPGGNNGRRPQYTSITRNRPATEAPLSDYDSDISPANRLNYVTIERNRQATTEIITGDGFETATSSGLQYVTLRRSSGRTTLSPQDLIADDSPNFISIDSNIFRSRPDRVEITSEKTTTTATTTTTTTPRPARIIVPQILLEPVTPKVINRLLLDPRNRNRARQPQLRQEVVQSTQRIRSPSRRTTTEPNVEPVTESSTSLPENEYIYEYEYIYDDFLKPLPTTELVPETLEIATSLPKTSDVAIEASSSKTNNLNIVSNTEMAEQVQDVITETIPPKTTVNLFANFQALITPSPLEDNVVEAKNIEETR